MEERILKLENMIRNAVIIDESKIDINVVTIGSIVKVNDMEFDEEVEYTIVGSAEADPYEGRISNESPVGRALLDTTVGQVVDVHVPDGVVKFKILEIRR
jgi:transcription elongation factor GreA